MANNLFTSAWSQPERVPIKAQVNILDMEFSQTIAGIPHKMTQFNLGSLARFNLIYVSVIGNLLVSGSALSIGCHVIDDGFDGQQQFTGSGSSVISVGAKINNVFIFGSRGALASLGAYNWSPTELAIANGDIVPNLINESAFGGGGVNRVAAVPFNVLPMTDSARVLLTFNQGVGGIINNHNIRYSVVGASA